MTNGAFTAVSVSAIGLNLRRGDHDLVAGLDFTVGPGAALAVTGPNGAGKTTLLMTVAGFWRPAAGTIAWTGLDADTPPRQSIHHLGHLSAVKPALTVIENLAFWRQLYGGAGNPGDVLADAGLAALAAYPAAVLSAGQLRRLALCRLAIATRPVWLLDEPASGLDTGAVGWLNRRLASHLGAGGIAVVATHHPLDLGAVAVAELDLGRRQAP